MSEFWKQVLADARRLASSPANVTLAQETPIEPAPEPPKEESVSLDQVVPSVKDRAIVVPVVLDNWSLLDKLDGEFVAPQGVGLVPCIIQTPKTDARPKVVTGAVISISFYKSMATTLGKNGIIYYIHLGKASKAYADFFSLTRLAHSYVGYEDIVSREALK